MRWLTPRCVQRHVMARASCGAVLQTGHVQTSLAKLSSPSERLLSTCVDRGERSRPSRRWWSERGGTAKKLKLKLKLTFAVRGEQVRSLASVPGCACIDTRACTGGHMGGDRLFRKNDNRKFRRALRAVASVVLTFTLVYKPAARDRHTFLRANLVYVCPPSPTPRPPSPPAWPPPPPSPPSSHRADLRTEQVHAFLA